MIEPVLYWNRIGLEANKNDHSGQMRAVNQRGPTLSARALAMLHIAMHDACVPYYSNAGYTAVLSTVPPPPTANTGQEQIGLAISNAACVILKELYPSQADMLDEYYRLIAADASNTDNNNAIEFGRAVGKEICENRRNDKSGTLPRRCGQRYHGNHKDDPFNSPQSLLGEDYGKTAHFALTGRVPLDPPPGYSAVAGQPAAYQLDVNSANYNVYLQHFDEVKRYGARRAEDRKIPQTISAICWAYDGVNGIGTPPRLYNQIAINVLSHLASGIAGTEKTLYLARALMLMNVAMADAATEAWFHKFTYDVWRPVVGIREHTDTPMAPIAAGLSALTDPFWEPLGAPNSNTLGKDFTPPFPAYPSGHATFGGAAFEMLRRIAGFGAQQEDNIQVTFVSDEMNGQTKDSSGTVRPRQQLQIPSLIQAMYDNGLSRVYLGVHWRFDATTASSPEEILTSKDNIGGIPLGRAVAQQVFDNLGGIQVLAPAASAA